MIASCYVHKPIDGHIKDIILIIDLIILIAVIYYLDIKFKISKSYKKSLCRDNLKYWLCGNIIALNIWFMFMIFTFTLAYYTSINSPIEVEDEKLEIFYTMFYEHRVFYFCLTLFFTSLIIKFLKKDLPFYYYGTICLFPIFIGFPVYLLIHNSTILGSWYRFYQDLRDIFIDPSLIRINLFALASFSGGSIVDIFRHFRQRYSNYLLSSQ